MVFVYVGLFTPRQTHLKGKRLLSIPAKSLRQRLGNLSGRYFLCAQKLEYGYLKQINLYPA